jgi:hypothetical protein
MGGAIAVPLVPLKVRFIHTTLQYAVLVLCMYYSTSPGRVMLNGILRHRGICAIYVIISVYYIFFNWPFYFLRAFAVCGTRVAVVGKFSYCIIQRHKQIPKIAIQY